MVKINLDRLEQEVRVFSHMSVIHEKLHKEGSIDKINDMISLLLENELSFAFKELGKYECQLGRKETLSYISNNSYIFKENLKALFELIGNLISRPSLEGKNEGERVNKED